jgi:uncharacterized protein YoaH (UPF0181 family)
MCSTEVMMSSHSLNPSVRENIAIVQMSSYQQHIKSEIPKLRGKGLSAQQAMSAAAKSWREKKEGGARQSRRVVNKDLAQLESLNVPQSKPGRKKRNVSTDISLEQCTDVESCKLQIRMLLAKQPPTWLQGSETTVRKLVVLLQQEDEIAKAIDAGKRKLGGIDRQIMQLAKSLNI